MEHYILLLRFQGRSGDSWSDWFGGTYLECRAREKELEEMQSSTRLTHSVIIKVEAVV